MKTTEELTASRVSRQNVLNNHYALENVKKAIGIRGVMFENEYKILLCDVAAFFEVSERTIMSLISKNGNELSENGYAVLTGKSLESFKLLCGDVFDGEVNFTTKTTRLSVFINLEIYHHWDSCKYIPLLRSGRFDESFPITIEARTGRDFSDDLRYEENLRILANDIKGFPENARPELRKNHEVLSAEEYEFDSQRSSMDDKIDAALKKSSNLDVE